MNDIREEMDAAIAQVGEIRKPRSEFFKCISYAAVEDVTSVLGHSLGSFLHGLCPVINLSHPDLGDVISGHHATQIMQAIEVAAFARRKVFTHLDFSKLLKTEVKEIEDKIRLLKMCARLLQKGERDAARAIKRIQTIDLSHAYKKWSDDIPADFKLYVRHNTAYKEEIEKYEKQAEHFKRLGCDAMSAEIKKSLDAFQESFDDTHYGFRRITMTVVALILGKMHNYPMSSVYVPAAYPAHELVLPDRVKEIINILDNFVEAGNNPVFDYYIVVTPKIDSPANLSTLIANNAMYPVLLGEKDGKCYFITMIF